MKAIIFFTILTTSLSSLSRNYRAPFIYNITLEQSDGFRDIQNIHIKSNGDAVISMTNLEGGKFCSNEGGRYFVKLADKQMTELNTLVNKTPLQEKPSYERVEVQFKTYYLPETSLGPTQELRNFLNDLMLKSIQSKEKVSLRLIAKRKGKVVHLKLKNNGDSSVSLSSKDAIKILLLQDDKFYLLKDMHHGLEIPISKEKKFKVKLPIKTKDDARVYFEVKPHNKILSLDLFLCSELKGRI